MLENLRRPTSLRTSVLLGVAGAVFDDVNRRIEAGDFAERAFGDAADFDQKVEGGVRIGANWGHGKPPWRSGGWKLVGMVAGERIALEHFVRKWRGESQGESNPRADGLGRPPYRGRLSQKETTRKGGMWAPVREKPQKSTPRTQAEACATGFSCGWGGRGYSR
jgi:hypothetical protein